MFANMNILRIFRQLSSPQVIHKNLPKPEIVSCVQSARRSGFPYDLQPPSSFFANLTSQVQLHVCRLPGIRTSRKKGRMFLRFQRFQHFRSAFFSFLATNFHLFSQPCLSKTPIFLACELSGKENSHYILLKITCYFTQYRMRSAILRIHLKIQMALKRDSGHVCGT